MNEKYEVRKHKCSICGKTTRTVMEKTLPKDFYPTSKYFKMASTGDLVCKACEREYHVIDNFSFRGYGYKYSIEPRFTDMDKRNSTPTFGIEIEIAGNIKNIEKIKLLTEKTQECSIGYDTSVEGAMFEFSYAPGTYYWYLHESHLRNVCKLIEKDPWSKTSDTIGNHIHFGNIDTRKFYANLITAANEDDMFWKVMRVIAEREFNRFCYNDFRVDHHDAISYSRRWRTVEFRFFAGTYSAEKILARMRFIRQIYNNITEEEGIEWHKFNQESINWFKTLLAKNRKFTKEEKEKILQIFEEETPKRLSNILYDPSGDIRRSFLNGESYRPFWTNEDNENDEYYENEEYEEYEEDY